MQIGSVLWDLDVTRPEYEKVSGELECDLCVIGLGANGLTATLAAAQTGLNVIAIDANRIAAGAGGRNGGVLLAGLHDFYHDARKLVGQEKAKKMYQLTLDEMQVIENTVPEAVSRNGALRIANDEQEIQDCKAHFAAMQEDGFEIHWYDGEQGIGLLIPSDGTFHPMKRVVALTKLATKAGARIFTHSPALEVKSGEVVTPTGKIKAKNILVAVDGKLSTIFPELANRVRPVRLQMIGTAPATEVSYPYAAYARDGWDYWQQLPNGRIAMGGGRDLSLETEFTYDDQPTELIRNYLSDRIRKLNVNAKVEYNWAATVSYSKNDLPICEEVKPNVYAIGAYCGTGNVIGALLGRAVVEKVSTGTSVAFDTFRSN